ncbi:cupin domain-containing protein [Pararhizobium sp. IMCC21322]|uniref:cupin domain-containing protein n=1 Tax=Pararhizobium sp. IMCC21322 TaxID=3067903 RepID=UPI002741974B|nr:cupin domain-containing protein [Pararhizobium sp. IMCC21322]
MFHNCKNMLLSQTSAVMPVANGQPAHGILDRFLKRLARRALVLALLTAATISSASYADTIEASTSGVERQMLYQSTLPDFPDRMVTALTIEIAPGAVVGPHRHGGFIYVYMLEGRVRSQMENEETVEYVAGQSWIEEADALHIQTTNSSTTESAKFLAVVYSDVGAQITKPEMDNH